MARQASDGGRFSRKAPEPSWPSGSGPLPRDGAHGERPRPVGGEAALIADERLRRARGARAGASQLVEDRGSIRASSAASSATHLVDEADVGSASRLEALPGREEGAARPTRRSWRPRTGDDGRDDAELRLGEAEDRVRRRHDDVVTAQRPIPPPSAAPWTRAITGTGHVSMAANMSAMAAASRSFSSRRQADAGAHPLDVGAGAERLDPSPASTTARSAVGGLVRQRVEGRAQRRRSARR